MKKIWLSVILIFIVLFMGTSALADDYVFTSEITETQNELTVNLDISPSVKNSFFIINAYKNNKVVAHKLVKADTLTKQVVLKCRTTPDDVRVNIWNSLVNVKPVINTVEYKSSGDSNTQTFTPKESFPADFLYVEGIVCANEKTAVDSATFMDKDYIRILSANNTYTTIYAPGINADQYLGKNVVVAYETYNEENILKNINETENNDIAVIDIPFNIQPNGSYKYSSSLTTDSYGNTLSGIISVYDEETDITNREYQLDNANIIFNGMYIQASYWNTSIGGALGTYLAPSFGTVKLLDNDGDDKYELIFVTSYETKVVDTVYAQNTKIGMKFGAALDLTNHIDGKAGYYYSITLDGKKIDIADLKESDVLSIASSRTGKNIEITVSRNVVEGAIEAIEVHANKLKEVYKIAGKEYTISNIASISYYPLININTEGYFYLDAFGKITYIESYPITRQNLAFIKAFGDYGYMGEIYYEIELLNKDGSVVVYNLANEITVKNNDTLVGKMTDEDVAYIIEELTYYNTTAGNYPKRIISYIANASGEITSINFSTAGVGEGLQYKYFTEEYEEGLDGFSSASIKEDAIVFYVPLEGYKDEYEICSPSVFEDGMKYSVAAFDIDDDLYSSLVVITSTINVECSDSLATVISSTVTEDKELKITFEQDGETKTLSIDKNSGYYLPHNNPFTKGSTFRYTLNLKGEIFEVYDETFVYESITNTNLAYIQNIGSYVSMGEECFEIELLNKDGSVVVYNLADSINCNTNGIMSASDVCELISMKIYTGSSAERIISYISNASGEITSINFSTEGVGEGLQYKYFTEEYEEGLDGFSSASIKEDAIVFYVPLEGYKDEYEICSPSVFEDGMKYSVAAFDIDDDLYSSLLVITSTINIECSDSLATVIRSTVTEDKEFKITFEQDGETKTLSIAKNSGYYLPYNNPFTKGSTFRYTLNLKGEIFDVYDETFAYNSITDTNLAFIQRFGDYSAMGEICYEIELLNKDGSIVIYNFADYITVNNNKAVIGKKENSEVAEMIYGLIQTNGASAYAHRIISYVANAKGEIISITFPDSNAGEGLSIAQGSDYDEYDESVSALMYGVTDETIIFYLPSNEWEGAMYDEFRILNISHLQDGTEYTTAYLDIDKDGNAGIMVITDDAIRIGGKDSLAVVVGTSVQPNKNNEKVIAVTFLQDGEEQTLLVDADSDINDIENNPFERGGLFEYSLNAEGEIERVEFGIKAGEVVYTPYDVVANRASADTARDTDKKIDYINGYVVAKNGSILVLNNRFAELVDGRYEDVTNGDRILITEGANIYTMDLSKTKVVPAVDAIGAITACNQYDGAAQKDQDTYVVVKIVDNRVTDVVVYNNINFKK